MAGVTSATMRLVYEGQLTVDKLGSINDDLRALGSASASIVPGTATVNIWQTSARGDDKDTITVDLEWTPTEGYL